MSIMNITRRRRSPNHLQRKSKERKEDDLLLHPGDKVTGIKSTPEGFMGSLQGKLEIRKFLGKGGGEGKEFFTLQTNFVRRLEYRPPPKKKKFKK